jgi:hypothetical protein
MPHKPISIFHDRSSIFIWPCNHYLSAQPHPVHIHQGPTTQPKHKLKPPSISQMRSIDTCTIEPCQAMSRETSQVSCSNAPSPTPDLYFPQVSRHRHSMRSSVVSEAKNQRSTIAIVLFLPHVHSTLRPQYQLAVSPPKQMKVSIIVVKPLVPSQSVILVLQLQKKKAN